MDRRDRSLRENRFPSCRRDQETPSFSSTLLDSIYRSIDQGSEDMLLYKEKLNRTGFHHEDDHEEMAKLRRACLIEKWMEKKAVTDNNKVVVRRGSIPDFQQRKARSNDNRDPLWLSHSSSSSSDSSSGSGFSSSETESKPKMILRSSVLAQQQEKFNKQMIRDQKDFSKAKHENGYVNTKSKAAMKIYNDFKKSKQPLSPGGRLTSFLNSLFTTASTKKTKNSTSARDQQREEMTKSKYDHPKTTCSSASSFSRSCLSKTQSSRGKLSSSSNVVAGTRSVKFCPVNIIVDEYYQLPHGQKTLHDVDVAMPSLESTKHRDSRNSMREELKLQILERNRRVEEVDARNLGKKCNKSTVYVKHEIDDDDDEDDAASYASSDLFELDSLSAIGIDEELPVYETTQFRVIPNGLIL